MTVIEAFHLSGEYRNLSSPVNFHLHPVTRTTYPTHRYLYTSLVSPLYIGLVRDADSVWTVRLAEPLTVCARSIQPMFGY